VILAGGVVIATQMAPDFPSNPTTSTFTEEDIVQAPPNEAEPSVEVAPALPTLHANPIDLIKVEGLAPTAQALPPMPTVGLQPSGPLPDSKIAAPSTAPGMPAPFQWRSKDGRLERRKMTDGSDAAEKAVLQACAGSRSIKTRTAHGARTIAVR